MPQVAEKGFVWLRCKVTGTPGHGSIPTKAHAVAKLAALLSEFVEQPRSDFECQSPVSFLLIAQPRASRTPPKMTQPSTISSPNTTHLYLEH